jgi:hypothetical protein
MCPQILSTTDFYGPELYYDYKGFSSGMDEYAVPIAPSQALLASHALEGIDLLFGSNDGEGNAEAAQTDCRPRTASVHRQVSDRLHDSSMLAQAASVNVAGFASTGGSIKVGLQYRIINRAGSYAPSGIEPVASLISSAVPGNTAADSCAAAFTATAQGSRCLRRAVASVSKWTVSKSDTAQTAPVLGCSAAR